MLFGQHLTRMSKMEFRCHDTTLKTENVIQKGLSKCEKKTFPVQPVMLKIDYQ